MTAPRTLTIPTRVAVPLSEVHHAALGGWGTAVVGVQTGDYLSGNDVGHPYALGLAGGALQLRAFDSGDVALDLDVATGLGVEAPAANAGVGVLSGARLWPNDGARRRRRRQRRRQRRRRQRRRRQRRRPRRPAGVHPPAGATCPLRGEVFVVPSVDGGSASSVDGSSE